MTTATTTTTATATRGGRTVPKPPARGRRAAETAVFVLAGLVAFAALYLGFFSTFHHGHAQAGLYGQFRSALAEGTAPTGEPIAHGTPVAILDSPQLGWQHEVVVEGTTPTDLESGVGHAIGTVLPGQAGTSVLMGRALSFGGPFGSLRDVAEATRISVTTGQGTFVYVVRARRASGDAFIAPKPGTSRLTLITLAGTHAWSPDSMLFVDLDLVGKAVAVGPVAPADPAGAPMAHDLSTATVAEFILSLQLVLAVVIAIVWARVRWSVIGAWACGVPTLLMALWLASTFAARMAVPNLL